MNENLKKIAIILNRASVAEEDAEGRKEKFRSVPRCEAGGKLPT